MARKGGLDRRAAEIVAWHVEGKSDAEIAALVSTKRRSYTRQAITQVRKRHAAEIAALQSKVGVAVEDKTIRVKAQRISNYDVAVKKIMEWIETHGLVSETQTVGEDGEQITDYRFNRGIVSALVDAQKAVAGELGELPKPEININTGDTNILALVNLADYGEEQQAAILRLALKAGS